MSSPPARLTVPLRSLGEDELLRTSRERQLSLSREEMGTIRDHFRAAGREPTDVELETFAQTWSEHCIHKTFKGRIELDGEVIELFRDTIAGVTSKLRLPWCFSVFEDNAGLVDFEGEMALAFKVETHNHPSAVEPFGGAATGVGGVIRDILGVWGEPIANTDVLCFGPLDLPYEELPPGVKHPRFIHSYVVAGIGAYGNNMGIPTVNGAIYFDRSYVGNPLVFCGTLGLVPKAKYARDVKPGDAVLLVGGKTGRDGVHGVTFASAELHERSEEVSATAVQIGDPIEEEKIKRGILRVRELGLGSAITDLGGGGLSSAVGEMAHRAGLGALVHLERVPLKYPGMRPWEVWISESQERMLLAVPKANLDRVMEHFAEEEVEATPIGEFVPGKRLRVLYRGEEVADLDLAFLFRGCPMVARKAKWKPPRLEEPSFPMDKDLGGDLLRILGSPNVASREGVIRTYDHEVRAATILKPIHGYGPGDAAVLRPLYDSWKGAVLSNGLNPEYGKIDPYWMAASAVDEAVRNNTAVGGRRIALLDNFCFGNPERPEVLGQLVRAAKGCSDTALAHGTPFISGKDSLYNESPLGPVTPTLLISALGIIPDVRRAVSMDLKGPGHRLYVLGTTRDELGGSHYYKIKGHTGKNVPRVYPDEARELFEALIKAMDMGLVRACHDLSEGGLGVAAAEMAFAGSVGLELDLGKVPLAGRMREDKVFFSESNSRLLVEVREEDSPEFEAALRGHSVASIGKTVDDKELVVKKGKKTLLKAGLDALRDAWEASL
ncbi:MAG: phosphoribosylformylglycinamidine synthase subunit PurL [Euryarchaeota archaeon]|nr:phosphoribosylformylglycinamidine synthase subunit PurL [Euryarchaeota archaeon]